MKSKTSPPAAAKATATPDIIEVIGRSILKMRK
jgi:hypothetical protein